MRQVTLRTAVSSAIFFVIILLWRGEGFGQEQMIQAMFSTIMFALFYAAIQVALIMFRGSDRDDS
ncbi:hypothetical protein A8B82_14995 [Sulfitobacter sp. EhC04]|uniref:hypothetical protein n=1 Tax=Sulfitobacter sp. EhC04 TaxID=1849168 RepID=UPI0007F37A52|nr:hypothetical protein [Sulfitobacter sp. EhC04]OAN76700.1 hypothetical protein A8B82_14995 [Sulfitobacter sp. EhC04]